MKNKILIAIIAILIIASVVFVSCSKNKDENSLSGVNAGSGIVTDTSTTLTPEEKSSLIDEMKENLMTATRPDGTPLVTEKGQSSNDKNSGKTTAKKKPQTTLSSSEATKLKNELAKQVNDYIASHGLGIDEASRNSDYQYYSEMFVPAELKDGRAFSSCKEIIDFVLLTQLEYPDSFEYQIKSMYCYYEGDIFYIMFSPNAVEKPTTEPVTEAPTAPTTTAKPTETTTAPTTVKPTEAPPQASADEPSAE